MANHINKSRLCIYFIILISLQTLHAQTYRPKKNYIGLHTGALSSSIKDELASPLTYKGSGAPIQLSYRFMGNKNRHSVYLSYSKLKLSPSAALPYGQHSQSHFQVDLAYGYHYLASLFRDKVKIYLGGVWDNHVSVRKLYYIWNDFETCGELISSLNISPLLEFKMSKKNQLAYQLSLPIVALVIRPPYAGKGPVIPKITTLNRFARFKNSLVLEHTLSRFFNIRLIYQYIYYRYPEPQRVQSGMEIPKTGCPFDQSRSLQCRRRLCARHESFSPCYGHRRHHRRRIWKSHLARTAQRMGLSTLSMAGAHPGHGNV